MAKSRKIKYDDDNPQPYEVLYRNSEMGRSSVEIRCPFCREQFTAYIWSISGGGKKCPDCGAMHVAQGLAFAVVK